MTTENLERPAGRQKLLAALCVTIVPLAGLGSVADRASGDVSDISIADYANQMDACYRVRSGVIRELSYDNSGEWNLLQLTGTGGVTKGGPVAVGAPAAALYANQLQVCYRDKSGNIQDAWYNGSTSEWTVQQLTGTAGLAGVGPVAVGNLSIVSYYNPQQQQHVFYRDKPGNIQDVWYNGLGRWSVLQLSGSGGQAGGPAAAKDPSAVLYSNQAHVCYADAEGFIHDVWSNESGPWSTLKLTGTGGLTDGPPAVGNLAVADYANQLHVCYRDKSGNIHDAWYNGSTDEWSHQQLTGARGWTHGPPATGNLSVVSYSNPQQMHVCYRDRAGIIRDVWYSGDGGWDVQQLTGKEGLTKGPAALGNLSVSIYSNQLHVLYRDIFGIICDVWSEESGPWQFQKISVKEK